MTSARPLARAALAAVLSVAVLSGCAAIGDRFGSGHSASGASNIPEVRFAQMMIPHHEQAVDMSQLAATRASDPAVLELAREIKAAQQPEIDRMTALLAARGASTLDDHAGHDMAGMMSDDALADLAEQSGPAFDRTFLTMMIAHHEGALSMAQPVVGSEDPVVRTLASEIVEAQTQEIAQMRTMLAGG